MLYRLYKQWHLNIHLSRHISCFAQYSAAFKTLRLCFFKNLHENGENGKVMSKLLWLVSGCIYESVPTDQSPKQTWEGHCSQHWAALRCPGVVPSCSSHCPVPPKDLKESGRTTDCHPQGFRAGLESRTAVRHSPGASVGTSWVSCCSSPSWPSLFQSLPKNCYVPVDHCAKQRDLTFGSATPFSLFYTRGRKTSQVAQIFLLFLSQTEINYSKAWISSETLKLTPTHTHYQLTVFSLNISFLACSNTTTLTKLLCWAQGNLAFHSSQGKTNILSRIINTGLAVVK